MCGPLISRYAGRRSAYTALLADSYHRTSVEIMAESESKRIAKAGVCEVNGKPQAEALENLSTSQLKVYIQFQSS